MNDHKAPSTATELLSWAESSAPELMPALPAALREADRMVTHRLAAALRVEKLADPRLDVTFGTDAGFSRASVQDVTWGGEPLEEVDQLLHRQANLRGAATYRNDVTNAVLHLALTLARQRTVQAQGGINLADPKLLEHCRQLDPVAAHLLLDAVNALGHNVHPLGRLRQGLDPQEALQYAAECLPDRSVELGLVAVRNRLLLRTAGREPGNPQLEQLLVAEFPELSETRRALPEPADYSLVPVHPWQLKHVVPEQFGREIAAGDLLVTDSTVSAEPTTSLRTLICLPGRTGRRLSVKTSINVRLTSTRRDISAATTANGPKISALLTEITRSDRWLADRIGVVPELAGTAFLPPEPEPNSARARGLSAVIRDDFAWLVPSGAVAISGSSLTSGVPGLGPNLLERSIDTLARGRGLTLPQAARRFLDRYADLFATSAMILLAGYGIGIEGHLQNTVLVLGEACEPTRVLLRDFGGMRIHMPRLERSGYCLDVYPGSITVSHDLDAVRSKAYYTCLQANLAELVLGIAQIYGTDPDESWENVARALLRGLARVSSMDPGLAAAAEADRDALFRPLAAQRAFVRLGLETTDGEHYAWVPNPLSKVPTP